MNNNIKNFELIWNIISILDINYDKNKLGDIFDKLVLELTNNKTEEQCSKLSILLFKQIKYHGFKSYLISESTLIKIINNILKLYLIDDDDNKNIIIKYPISKGEYKINIDLIDSDLIKNIAKLDNDSIIELTNYENIFKYIVDYNFNGLISTIDIEKYLEDNTIIKKQIEDIFDSLNYFGSNILLNQYLVWIDMWIKKYEKLKREKEIEQFYDKYIDKLNWFELSGNTSVSEQFFEKYFKYYESSNNSDNFDLRCIKWSRLSGNTNIGEQFFEKYIHLVNWNCLSRNTNMSEQFFEKYIHLVNWDSVSKNKNIGEQFFEIYLDKINYNILSENENISKQFFEKLIINEKNSKNEVKVKVRENLDNDLEEFEKEFKEEFEEDFEEEFKEEFEEDLDYEENKLNWKKLSLHSNLNELFYEKYLNKVDWSSLSINKNISEQFFEKYLNKINWNNISQNTYINESFFEKHINNVSWYFLSGNITLSESFFEKHSNKINWYVLSQNRNLSEQFIEKNIRKFREYWNYISLNKNISEQFFEKYLDRINWHTISFNTNISEQFFEKYIDKISWNNLSFNTNISEQFFEKHLDKVVWLTLIGNKNISLNFFEKHIEYLDKKCWKLLSSNEIINHIKKPNTNYFKFDKQLKKLSESLNKS